MSTTRFYSTKKTQYVDKINSRLKTHRPERLQGIKIDSFFSQAIQRKSAIHVLTQQFTKRLGESHAKDRPTSQYFNPELHHAVAIEDGEQSSMEEIRKGYVLNGKVIRPALVKLTNKGGSNE